METFMPYFLLGLAFIILGILVITKGKKKRGRCTVSTIATITTVEEDLDIRTDMDSSNPGNVQRYRYKPTFTYQVNGYVYTCQGVYVYDDKKRFTIGGTEQLWYNPSNPADATTQVAASSKSKTGGVFIFIGLMLCVLAYTQL